MTTKKHVYTVHVEDDSIYDVLFDIRADNRKEAKEKAKDMFIRRHWNRKKLKAEIMDVNDNI